MGEVEDCEEIIVIREFNQVLIYWPELMQVFRVSESFLKTSRLKNRFPRDLPVICGRPGREHAWLHGRVAVRIKDEIPHASTQWLQD